MAEGKHVDDLTGIATTGHEWDGVRELDNPLPNWWRWIFGACVVWAFGYWIFYPSWPLLSSYSKGILGYSSRAHVADELSDAKERQKAQLQKLDKASLESIRTDPELLEFALAGGRSAFNVNCSQCHGSGAQGFTGYPNLNDDEWLWGGNLQDIYTTISHGIRNTDDEAARTADMPAFLKDEILDSKMISDVAEYVLSLSKSASDDAAAGRGEAVYAENCAVCHNENGAGGKELGPPALNNTIWLYGGDKATIVKTISYGRGGVMPAWGRILDDATIKKLAIYVHSLGGGT